MALVAAFAHFIGHSCNNGFFHDAIRKELNF